MSLDSTSRYQLDTNSVGVFTHTVAVRKATTSSTYSTYVSKDEDTFEQLASKVFGDGTQYWRLADLNPHVKFPNVIPVGTSIRLPQ
jgi:nucleoid-associated protein YgaU